ncbi:MAG: hypothetical protein NTX85_01045 [Candidatus Nomurabacteria bacterium]|nr:hypothetical protein [Candidatus Nomurabacteria bacterium]
MKTSVFCGFILIALFAVVIGFNAFFPTLSTPEQKVNCSLLALLSLVVGMGLLVYSRNKGYKIL